MIRTIGQRRRARDAGPAPAKLPGDPRSNPHNMQQDRAREAIKAGFIRYKQVGQGDSRESIQVRKPTQEEWKIAEERAIEAYLNQPWNRAYREHSNFIEFGDVGGPKAEPRGSARFQINGPLSDQGRARSIANRRRLQISTGSDNETSRPGVQL